MPKDTFFNLPKDKRERIERAAIEEFRDYYYDASSVNRIVEAAEIAKGSFYQYFAGKKDLYMYIMDMIIEKKLEHLSPTLKNPFGLNIFTLLREMYKSGLDFAFNNPDLLEIGNKLLSDTNHEIFKELMEGNKNKSDEVFVIMLKEAENRGEIRAGMDLDMVAYLLTSLNITISDYYMKINNSRSYSPEMIRIIDQFLDFIQKGIANTEGGNAYD